jgi:hypothetical protein
MAEPSIGPSSKSYKATLTEKKKPVLNRADTIEKELIGQLNEKVLSAGANLLYDIGEHKLDDGPGISSELSLIDFEQIPAQTKIMSSIKLVCRPPFLRKGSSGKRGSVCSEGGSSDNSDSIDRMLKNPGPL